ncbi:E3 ubiquitin-protein ligase UBR3 [Orchesella cincta]|uniref:E3 ubiquitin-protein ligase n=1 Tax=Orchesella cincta TaxID=48709 RepID=A0A1D2N540_ORCCI|nr:E3 ubiquitin-protein ligase UBR3 [Orchesella cincta]
MDTDVLLKKGYRAAAAYIHAECSRSTRPENLNKLLDNLLNPTKEIDNWETIEWCKWLMAGGCTPDEFAANVRRYDNATTCGLVWTANFVAYRCRTCGISPCMSLCAECFQRGNHKGHDFNMFRSQAGGACDCGDTNVMKETGFCYLHGPQSRHRHGADDENAAPPDLLCVANAMLPRLVLRLIQHLRLNSTSLNGLLGAVTSSDRFIDMLHHLSSMGAAMRQVITHALTNPQIYKTLTEPVEGSVSQELFAFMCNTKQTYEEALTSLTNPDPPEEYKDIPSLQKVLVHRTFLEELVFWTAKGEFPQKIVCLLLNLLPDPDYKEAFTRAFVLHYSRISQLLVKSEDADTLSNRVVHVSVQLFSNEKLALKMAEQMGLLHVMVISLQYMMSSISVPSPLHGKDKFYHRVVDCNSSVMKDHCYWPLVSDLNNILSHRPVALKFLEDDGLLHMWFNFLSMFQGMNVNSREMNQHIEYEPTTYYAAFSAELEASASPMWALVSHLRDASTAHLTKNLLRHCRAQLSEWLHSVTSEMTQNDSMQVSFHLPLHRYFSVFLYQAVRNQGLSLAELLPPPNELKAMVQHPLRVQTAFYEIVSGMWVRNGLQIKGQAMTYIQCHFCNCTVDADLSLLQLGMMYLPRAEFINSVSCSRIVKYIFTVTNSYLEPDQEMLMMENCLIFLATLSSIRTALGLSDGDLVTLEMVTLLCMGDKTHSQLMELMPERCGNSSQSRDFEMVLAKVADYKAPNFESSGNMLQGMYIPKSHIWESLYDPIYILLRAVHRRDFQTSLDRFTEYAKQSGKYKGSGAPWPPFRVPGSVTDPYIDPRQILLTKVVQGMLFVIFYKAVHSTQLSEQVIALAIYLLEMAVTICDSIGVSSVTPHEVSYGRYDMDFGSWYTTDCLLANLRSEIDSVLVKPVSRGSGGDDVSVDEMEVESYEGDADYYDYETVPAYTSGDYPMDTMGSHAFALPDGSAPLNLATTLAIMPSPTVNTTALVRARDSSTSGSNQREAHRQSGLQMVLAPHKPVITVQKKGVVERNSSMSGSQAPVEVVINDSMISLLLRLHSKLSSIPDSYVPYWETPEAQKLISEAITGETNNGVLMDLSSAMSCDSVHEDSPSSSRGSGCIIVNSLRRDGLSPEYSGLEYNRRVNYQVLYNLLKGDSHEIRIGDGPFFISKLLDKIGAKDESCREHVINAREKLWPRKKLEAEEETKLREEREKEERRRKARERQSKLMAEFAKKQQMFMAKAMTEEFVESSAPTSTSGDGLGADSSYTDLPGMEGMGIGSPSSTIKPIEYDCVICGQTTPSTSDNPVGLVTLLQPSSVLGHRQKAGSSASFLPTTAEEEHAAARDRDIMSVNNERRVDEYKQYFNDSSWLLSISGGWEGGVHVQTCGHHIHMDCLKGYLQALKSQQRQHNISVDRGEYLCPLCRQLANSFLPLSPEFGIRQSALVKDRKMASHHVPGTPEATVPEIPPSPESNVALEVVKLLREYPVPTVPCKMMDAMTKTMEEMTNATILKFRQVGNSKDPKSILLFVNSIARTNLELELTLRGGNLVHEPQPSTSSSSSMSSSNARQRSCIVPLLHVLGVHYKILSTDHCAPKIWERVLGIRFLPDTSLMPFDRDVPILLRDPITTLLHLLMQLPMHVDLAYFTSIVQGIFNLVYVEILCKLSSSMREAEREYWKAKTSLHSFPNDLNKSFFLLGTRRKGAKQCARRRLFGAAEIESYLLPYLRIASLLRHHIYEQEIPPITSLEAEFSVLAEFLTLGSNRSSSNTSCVNEAFVSPPMSPTTSFTATTVQRHEHVAMNLPKSRAHDFLHWISPTPLTAIWTWCEDLCSFISRAQVSSRFLIQSQHVLWGQPRLMDLPEAYDSIFQYYHRKQCPNCNTVPKEPTICLVCGTMVCLRDVAVNIPPPVFRKKGLPLGSVYLDAFGEEDRELKRGKPLFLSKERYALLHQQWVAHRFDHTNRKWIWHRDTL